MGHDKICCTESSSAGVVTVTGCYISVETLLRHFDNETVSSKFFLFKEIIAFLFEVLR